MDGCGESRSRSPDLELAGASDGRSPRSETAFTASKDEESYIGLIGKVGEQEVRKGFVSRGYPEPRSPFLVDE